MAGDLPPYFFRVRDNGALVYRVQTEARSRRIEMDQIAVVNVKKREIKPHGDRTLTAEDIARIEEWMTARIALLARRDLDDIHRSVDHLNQTAQWAQSTATDAELEDVTDALLLAMHDLREVLIRKKADRVMRARGET